MLDLAACCDDQLRGAGGCLQPSAKAPAHTRNLITNKSGTARKSGFVATQKRFVLLSHDFGSYVDAARSPFPAHIKGHRVEWAAGSAVINSVTPAREAKMGIAMRLNVLAACVSFGFIAAIVFGMV